MPGGPSPRVIATPAGDIVLEMVGQVANAPAGAGVISLQYGYLAFIHGIAGVFKPAARVHDETTALYTFFTAAATTATASDGLLTIRTRTGTTTLYQTTSAGTFAAPASFRRGTPIQVSTFRQQVVRDNATRAFTSVNINTVTAVAPFASGGGAVELGRIGDAFRTSLTGHFTALGVTFPCGYFAGYAVAIGGRSAAVVPPTEGVDGRPWVKLWPEVSPAMAPRIGPEVKYRC